MNTPSRHTIWPALTLVLFAQVLTGCAESSDEQGLNNDVDLFTICQEAHECSEDCGRGEAIDARLECIDANCYDASDWDECVDACTEASGLAEAEACNDMCKIPPGGSSASGAEVQAAIDGVESAADCSELYL